MLALVLLLAGCATMGTTEEQRLTAFGGCVLGVAGLAAEMILGPFGAWMLGDVSACVP